MSFEGFVQLHDIVPVHFLLSSSQVTDLFFFFLLHKAASQEEMVLHMIVLGLTTHQGHARCNMRKLNLCFPTSGRCSYC